MADLNELQLTNEGPEVADALPAERSARLPMLQPGLGICFQLPEKFDFDTFNLEGSGQRLMVKFADALALKVYPSGTPVRTVINNMEREREDEKGADVKVNALAYLLRNSLGFTGPLKTNRDYAVALSQYAGHYFVADWTWTAKCNKKRDIYREGEGTIDGRSGCGQTYALKGRTYKNRDGVKVTVLTLPREGDGTFVESFRCQGKRADDKQCDATLFANGELSNFRPAQTAEAEGEQKQA